jgi:adenylate cyclase
LVASAKILAVDDEPDFELLIKQRFRRQIRDEEFEFRFAHHGEEALTALSAEPDIELMLLDINMPVMDGLTLLNELRERQLPVQAIIVSAYGDMTNLRAAMNRGAFDFVTKPVDLSDLEITVRKALANIAKARDMDRRRMAAERARNNLSRYFSPNIVELLAAQDEPLGAGRRETVAVLFADIVAFTRMAEVMAPEDVLALLREFHARMTAQIFASGGTVDQYMGDGIFAVFGAPAASPDDAANALNCAEMMLNALQRWNDEREREGDARLDIGIGLNYGPVVLGDVGSEHSMSFTAIGDTVNTAARLQVLTRALQRPLVVGDAVVQAIKALSPEIAAERTRKLEDQGEHNLRGRASPVRVWTPKVERIRESAPFDAASESLLRSGLRISDVPEVSDFEAWSGFSSANDPRTELLDLSPSNVLAPQICARLASHF